MDGDGISVEFWVEAAGDGEHGIPDGLGLEAADGGFVEEDVFGVGIGEELGVEIRIWVGGLLVGLREDNFADEFLLRPVVFDEKTSQRIEELGV